MPKGRLEAFSDGVIAIIITIMVLELKIPRESGAYLGDLWLLRGSFVSYILSFIFLCIYWNNHHHLLHTVKRVNGPILWANSHLLFWLSLVPFATAWMGENHFASWPVAVYGMVLLCAAVAYYILTQVIIKTHGNDSLLGQAVGVGAKELISIFLYILAIGLSFNAAKLSCLLYALVAVMWLVPDQRIERSLDDKHSVS